MENNMADSTGLPGLDKILNGIIPGDNIVWQTDSIDDFMPYVKPYTDYAKKHGRKLVYFRFAKHKPFVASDSGAEIVRLNPEEGFEKFITGMHDVITRTGSGGYYIFDSLSELAIDYFSERMIGNFFMLTGPMLYSFGGMAYCPVIRNQHSYHAALPIAQTTQLLLDIYNHKGNKYVHPLKVKNRHSPTMYMLHVWEGSAFIPVVESIINSEVST